MVHHTFWLVDTKLVNVEPQTPNVVQVHVSFMHYYELHRNCSNHASRLKRDHKAILKFPLELNVVPTLVFPVDLDLPHNVAIAEMPEDLPAYVPHRVWSHIKDKVLNFMRTNLDFGDAQRVGFEMAADVEVSTVDVADLVQDPASFHDVALDEDRDIYLVDDDSQDIEIFDDDNDCFHDDNHHDPGMCKDHYYGFHDNSHSSEFGGILDHSISLPTAELMYC